MTSKELSSSQLFEADYPVISVATYTPIYQSQLSNLTDDCPVGKYISTFKAIYDSASGACILHYFELSKHQTQARGWWFILQNLGGFKFLTNPLS